MKQLGVTDPAPWSAPDWASDAIPHLARRAVICTALRFMSPDHVPAA